MPSGRHSLSLDAALDPLWHSPAETQLRMALTTSFELVHAACSETRLPHADLRDGVREAIEVGDREPIEVGNPHVTWATAEHQVVEDREPDAETAHRDGAVAEATLLVIGDELAVT